MKKGSKKNLEQLAKHLNKNQVIDNQKKTALKGGNIVIDDIML